MLCEVQSRVGEPLMAPAWPDGYPVRIEGELKPNLSHWLWLVEWLLLIPHIIMLVNLWLAFFVLMVVAFFAILITERYPRAIFDFNLGVMRADVAGGVLLVQRARHRPLPSVHPRMARRLPRMTGRI
jgi:hypothetical protein